MLDSTSTLETNAGTSMWLLVGSGVGEFYVAIRFWGAELEKISGKSLFGPLLSFHMCHARRVPKTAPANWRQLLSTSSECPQPKHEVVHQFKIYIKTPASASESALQNPRVATAWVKYIPLLIDSATKQMLPLGRIKHTRSLHDKKPGGTSRPPGPLPTLATR